MLKGNNLVCVFLHKGVVYQLYTTHKDYMDCNPISVPSRPLTWFSGTEGQR